MTLLSGRCHCGAIEISFETAVPAAELSVRACQCSFCRRHGARTTSDPGGRVRIVLHRPNEVLRYRFGLRTADFLVCGRCGIYVAAVADERYATVNVNTFEEPIAQAAVPVSFESENPAEREARRRARWTPAVIVVAL